MSIPTQKNSIANAIKIYFFPSVVTVLAMMIWRDVNELRTDVKLLLAESNSNKAKVENLEKQVQQLNQAVFKMPRPISDVPKHPDSQMIIDYYAILNRDEHYDIIKKKFIPYKIS